MTSNPSVSGSCLCGAVRFELELPAKWCAHCHCTMCQRAHGAAFVTWVGVDEAVLRLDDNSDCLSWFSSSDNAERGFCGRCGSTLFFKSQRWPGEIHVVRSNIVGNIDPEPQAHVYYDTHVSWFDVEDNLGKKP
ncbi:MAG: GFA family protein [Gammaproteobacteria bacterium]